MSEEEYVEEETEPVNNTAVVPSQGIGVPQTIAQGQVRQPPQNEWDYMLQRQKNELKHEIEKHVIDGSSDKAFALAEIRGGELARPMLDPTNPYPIQRIIFRKIG